jgi:hypothetical protein
MRPKHRTHREPGGESGVVRPSVAAVNRLARRQHGLVTRRQLLELGMEPRAIARRLESGRLTRVRRGVYRLGPIAQPLERDMAAILATPGATLSHRSAAALHKLLPYPAKDGPVHLTVTGVDRGPKSGIQIHRTKELPADEITQRHRIPVTTPARTILDLAAMLGPSALEQLLAEAHHRGRARDLPTLIARYPRRPGVPLLRDLLELGPKFTRSKPERRYLEAFRRAGLPEPLTNVPLAGYEVDFLWEESRVVLEVDGDPFHSARPDRVRDYRRDARLGDLGFRVLRIDADEPVDRAVALIARATR